jgi:hypothetical protein
MKFVLDAGCLPLAAATSCQPDATHKFEIQFLSVETVSFETTTELPNALVRPRTVNRSDGITEEENEIRGQMIARGDESVNGIPSN